MKAFILVGHSDWGKTKTILSLKGENRRCQYIKISGKWFLTRTRSNDDIYCELLDMVKKIVKWEKDYLLILLCPNFKDKDKCTNLILDELIKKYKIYFFVLKEKYNSDRYITEDEINELKKYGNVRIFKGQKEKEIRAKVLKEYITENI